jgi:histone-lysine N-methyltransferase SETD1
MVVHNDPGEVGTLATVTIQRLWTPEQTKYGRTVHDRLELFDDHNGKVHFQAPVEDLFLIGKSVSRYLDESQLPNNENAEWNFHITHSYNASDGTHKPLFGNVCNCRRCNVSDVKVSMDPIFSLSRDKHDNQYTVDESISSLVKLIMKSGNPVNFSLRNHVGVATMRPSFIPNIGVMKSSMYSEVKTADGDKKNQKQARKKRLKIVHSDNLQVEYKKEDVVKVEPNCSRTVPFGDITSDYWYLRNKNTSSIGLRRDPSTREIARPRAVNSKTKEEVTLFTGRAARANQRHLVKSMGSASTSLDRLAGRDRERHLRFGKSTIEGWGVFAEEPISAGDLIVEYRGELIGHAVADKREREYEDANIPDYMFRIDALTVCDATRLGNVARFINASCNPNCYTQIITANENKRIVIYAKRNIARGEELCYDYKFPIEMDPTKRIRCGCGSIECRGYMNWDKRWD